MALLLKLSLAGARAERFRDAMRVERMWKGREVNCVGCVSSWRVGESRLAC